MKDLEKRLIYAGATPPRKQDKSPSKDTDEQRQLDTLLSYVYLLETEAAQAQPEDDASMELFTSQCHAFVEKTMNTLKENKNPSADYKTAHDYLIDYMMDYINPLLETFGYAPYKTASFRTTLAHLKNETEYMQDQDDDDDALKGNSSKQ